MTVQDMLWLLDSKVRAVNDVFSNLPDSSSEDAMGDPDLDDGPMLHPSVHHVVSSELRMCESFSVDVVISRGDVQLPHSPNNHAHLFTTLSGD